MTRVNIDIRSLATGCELTLTYENVLGEWAERTEEGWGEILAGLALEVE